MSRLCTVPQLIAAYKVDYSGTISSELAGLVEDPSIPKELLKEFLASGAVSTLPFRLC